ncbi:hypothetical protein PF001_g4752 [Phytophthora fragariae]|uniref:Uncharacterized protein n=1 Tax=Phytophthora fragariae TaxID=53985 RepID=A0A6A4EFS9_9STRA|nr:hypothetical protein PF001_g4752 [Phytophthora fragariae]
MLASSPTLQAPEDGLLAILYQSDNIDIPVTISYCMGEWRPMQSNSLTACSKYALREIISYGDAIVSNWKRFTGFMKTRAS